MSNSLTLLPLTDSELESGVSEAINVLLSAGLCKDEAEIKLGSSFEIWLDADTTCDPLPTYLRPLLASASWASQLPSQAHASYASLIRKMVGKHVGTKREAAVFLSQLPLMLLLATDFSASPARIAQLLGSADGRNPVSWRAVQTVLVHLGIRNELDTNLAALLISKDEEFSAVEFGDADVATLVEFLANQSASYGLGEGFKDALSALFTPTYGEPFIPYLQILLYVSVVDHFYDHPPEFIYTFKPRGVVANCVFAKFPAQLAPGGNPMLNNFKAVDRLTYDWAESREDNRIHATALVTVVLGLSSLSFPARKQLSGTIRRGIFRFIEVKTPAQINIPTASEIGQIKTFLENVAAAPTGTRGIIEQRVTDFLGVMSHRDITWRSRGLGDPVNASNTASRKLGDCDFQNAVTHRCHAIEAHAGRLTDVYLDEHLRTLRLNLPKRIGEWSGISEISDWSLEVTFIAHEDARSAPSDTLQLEVPCLLKVKTFAQAAAIVLETATDKAEPCLAIFNKWVVAQLNASNTPHYAKRKALELFTSSCQ